MHFWQDLFHYVGVGPVSFNLFLALLGSLRSAYFILATGCGAVCEEKIVDHNTWFITDDFVNLVWH